jgi:hypothetical protein
MSAEDTPRRPSAAARIRAKASAPQTSPNTGRCRQPAISSRSTAPEMASAASSSPGESTFRPLRTVADPRGVRS